jgi:type I restriction enzyme S subunit
VTGPWPERMNTQVVALGSIAEIQLGKMLQPSPDSLSDSEVPYLRAGTLSSLGFVDDLPRMYASARDKSQYSVAPGDLVVAEGGDVGRTAFLPMVPPHAIIQNSLHRVRSSSADIRYLRYCIDAIYASGWLDVLCNKSTFGHLTHEKLTSLPIPVVSRDQQTAVANHLDTEMARIDALVAKKRQLIEVVEERRMSSLPAAFAERGFHFPTSLAPDWSRVRLPQAWRIIRLSQVLRRLTNGYVGPTRDILRDSGIRYVQSLHIKNGAINFARRPFFVDESWHRERPRIHLRPGDVLIVQTGDIGQIAVVPEGFGQASCHALQIARVDPTLLSGEYLGAYLRSPFGYQSLLSRATGALHPHLEGGIRDVPIVVPPQAMQAKVVDEIARASERLATLGHAITRQIDLLGEHRQALISAGVTGELEVTGMAA